jgi:hypothetical protein
MFRKIGTIEQKQKSYFSIWIEKTFQYVNSTYQEIEYI